MIGENRLSFVAETHEELNVPRRPQHRAGVELMGIGYDLLDLVHQGFADPLVLVAGVHREQTDNADARYRPEAHGTDECAFFFRDDNMFLSCVCLEALKCFRCPAADLIEAGILTERSLLHLEDHRKICFSCGSNVHHGMASG